MRAAWLVIAIAALLAITWLAMRSWQAQPTVRAIEDGLRSLDTAISPREAQAVLEQWSADQAETIRTRREELLTRLELRGVRDIRVRRLVTHLTGADFGDDFAAWEQWFDERRALQDRKLPRIPTRMRVRLRDRWSAPIGRLLPESRLLAVEGAIYVGTCGRAFGDARDTADGVVRVSGADGDAALIFIPPEPPPRDILGISVADEGLLVAARNGHVYRIKLSGEVQWRQACGDLLASPCLAADVDRDGHADVVVATGGGRVLCLNGRTGTPLWSAGVQAAPRSTDAAALVARRSAPLRTRFAAHFSAGIGQVFAATIGGQTTAFNALNGQVLWRRDTGAAISASPVVLDENVAVPVVSGGLRHFPLRRGEPAAQTLNVIADPGFALLSGPRPLPLSAQADGQILVTARLVAPPETRVALWRGSLRVWQRPLPGTLVGEPGTANLDSRGGVETALVTQRADGRGVLWVLADSGRLSAASVFEAGVATGPTIADVDCDGKLDVLVADRAGRLHCFSTPGHGPIEWGVPGGDAWGLSNVKSAYYWSQAPCSARARWRPAGE